MERVWDCAEGRRDPEGTRGFGAGEGSHYGDRDAKEGESYEAQDSGCPAKADLGLKSAKCDGIDDSSCSGNTINFGPWDGIAQGDTVPILLPETAIPVARARLVVKYTATMAMLGIKRQPLPSPMQIPCERKTW